MASLTITLTGVCSGGNHLTFGVTGAASRTKVIELNTLTEPLDETDVEAFLRVVTRLARQGRTNAQARTLLQAGVTVTI